MTTPSPAGSSLPDVGLALRALPAVTRLLEHPRIVRWREEGVSHERLVSHLQAVLADARGQIRAGAPCEGTDGLLDRVADRLVAERIASLRPVVNATGVVLNTNLGRAPLSRAACEAIAATARGYCNLEYDLQTGQRGSRMSHLERLLVQLTGAEAAVVVNNNAAAVLLVVDTLARGREVILSRGQLVEIGGSFRMPEVIEASGARLVEVGCTNRTHLSDYERAIGPDTALLMRCHPSNFRMVGFTSEVEPAELASLAEARGVVFVDDLGSGMLVPPDILGLPPEPTVQGAIAAGTHLVTFSGDKLLGGPQAGIVVGKRALVERLRRNPLMRALRVDKLVIAALEATLRAYLDRARALGEVPTLAMLARPLTELEAAARALADTLGDLPGLALELAPGVSMVGGGSYPGVESPTMRVGLTLEGWSAAALQAALRAAAVPVVARVEHDRVWLDPRTLLPGDERLVQLALVNVVAGRSA
ncbi:MAG: L-seryl-tRNA(Sec) selenium transferase [bacterium]|nr:L-seryl-tRNA(Sec) selenium transferase [bacterium]